MAGPKLDHDEVVPGYLVLVISIIPLTLSIEYSTSPFRKKTKQFFKEQKYEDSVLKYEYPKQMLYVIIPILIFIIVVSTVLESTLDWENYFLTKDYFLNSIVAGLGISLMSISAYLILLLIKKDFKYQFARICFYISKEHTNETEQFKFFMKGVYSLNSYLRRNFKLEIKDVGKIYFKFLSATVENKKSDLKMIIKSFANDDQLEPLKSMAKLLKIEPNEEFIVNSSIVNIKELVPMIVASITGIVGFIRLLELLT